MKDEPYYEYQDSNYCYPGTDVLRNKFDIRDSDALASVEGSITMIKMMDLDIHPVEGKFDSGHLKEIHRRIFSDIYEWAGEYRTVEISKGIPFCRCEYIQSELDRVLNQLKSENLLKNIDDRSFMISRLAYYMSEINAIHPFREGNGRVQRKFIEQIARNAGFELNLDSIGSKEMSNAGLASMSCDYKPMEKIIGKSLSYQIEDVYNDAYGVKTSGAKSWEGHARNIIGNQIECQSQNVFTIPLTKIVEPGGFKTPDFINPEHRVCVEVFSGVSKGKVVDVISGIPIVNVRKNTAVNHVIEALRHAKTKFNPDAEGYIHSHYHVSGDMIKIAMCSMDFTDYCQITKEDITVRLNGIHLSDYGVDALVVYFIPAGLSDEFYGGDVYVFYSGEIEKSLFIEGTDFVYLG